MVHAAVCIIGVNMETPGVLFSGVVSLIATWIEAGALTVPLVKMAHAAVDGIGVDGIQPGVQKTMAVSLTVGMPHLTLHLPLHQQWLQEGVMT